MTLTITCPEWVALASHTRSSLERFSARRAVALWADRYPVLAGDVDTLIDRADRHRDAAAVTAALIALHRSGDQAATGVLVLSRLPMLRSVSRHAHVDSADYNDRNAVQLQQTLTGFMTVLAGVDIDDDHVVEALYFRTLHAVTDRRRKLDVVSVGDAREFLATKSIDSDASGTVSVADLVAVANRRRPGAVSDRDAAVLMAMYDRAETITVAELAASLGLTESALESRLRRAVARLRGACTSEVAQAA